MANISRALYEQARKQGMQPGNFSPGIFVNILKAQKTFAVVI